MAIRVNINEFSNNNVIDFVFVEELDYGYKLIINTKDRWCNFHENSGAVKIENEFEDIIAQVTYETDEYTVGYTSQEKDQIYLVLLISKPEKAKNSFVVKNQ